MSDKYKEDLRIVRTRAMLCKSFFELLETTPYEKISVIDICNNAMIHRATFYNHFDDKEHLLEYAIDEIKEELFNKTIKNEKYNSPKDMYMSLISQVIDFIEEYRSKILIIINNNSRDKVTGILQTSIKRSIKYLTSKNIYKAEFSLPANVVIEFLTGGITNLGLSWLVAENPCSKEELLHYFNILLNEKIYIKNN